MAALWLFVIRYLKCLSIWFPGTLLDVIHGHLYVLNLEIEEVHVGKINEMEGRDQASIFKY